MNTGSGESVLYTGLGNVLTVVGPGNNAATQITTTLNYTTDGGYSQSAKLGQPLTVTNNLGHVTHMRYDSQGRLTSVTDALGNETNASYNLVGSLTPLLCRRPARPEQAAAAALTPTFTWAGR
ncbi:MAG: RHS repeat domain-containing protein [Acidobacteriota bacterium]